MEFIASTNAKSPSAWGSLYYYVNTVNIFLMIYIDKGYFDRHYCPDNSSPTYSCPESGCLIRKGKFGDILWISKILERRCRLQFHQKHLSSWNTSLGNHTGRCKYGADKISLKNHDSTKQFYIWWYLWDNANHSVIYSQPSKSQADP